jgi:ERCC4-related helicase
VETLRLRQCLSDPAILEDSAPSTKMVVLEQVVEEILSDSKNKIVVFSCFRPTIEAIVKKFKHHNAVMFAGINKDLKQEDRDGNITKFLTDPSCRLLIANSSLGAGGNWGQVARYGIFYDLPESRLDWKQSFGRITRRDAVGTSNIIVFLSHGTCEMKLWDALDTKNDTIDSILGKDQELTLDVRSILD